MQPILNFLLFAAIFAIGETLMNLTLFPYLKRYFKFSERKANEENDTIKPFMGISLSVAKGLLERFTLYFCMVIGLTQVMVVFGALKLGTRLDKTKEVTNDYFLIGNLISILATAAYYSLYLWFGTYINWCR